MQSSDICTCMGPNYKLGTCINKEMAYKTGVKSAIEVIAQPNAATNSSTTRYPTRAIGVLRADRFIVTACT